MSNESENFLKLDKALGYEGESLQNFLKESITNEREKRLHDA